jgi:acyl-CoA reductase-like NAD-dependent aldehyde dehydrogenase
LITPLLRKGDYIYGSFVKPENINGYINNTNPGDLSDHLGRVPFSLSNTNEAIAYTKIIAPSWTQTPLSERQTIVKKFLKHIEKQLRKRNLISLITRETGVPNWEALQEIKECIYILENLLQESTDIYGKKSKEENLQGISVEKKGRGVIACITPFSSSLYTSVFFTAGAILAGNCVIHNPSKYTPLIGQFIAEAWDHTPLPRGVYSLIQGPGSHVGSLLCKDPSIQGVLFAGSLQVAKTVQRKTPPYKFSAIYIGGKSAAIVLDDCDFDTTTKTIISISFRAAGQRPYSICRVFGSKKALAEIEKRLHEELKKLIIGYGEVKGVYFGPLISEHWKKRYLHFGQDITKNGHAAVLSAKEALDYKKYNDEDEPSDIPQYRQGFFVRPAIYRIDWKNNRNFLEEEPPGPFLLLYETESVNESILLHNQQTYRNMATIFGNPSSDQIPQTCQDLQSGAIFINHPPQEVSLEYTSQGNTANRNRGISLLRDLCARKLVFQLK